MNKIAILAAFSMTSAAMAQQYSYTLDPMGGVSYVERIGNTYYYTPSAYTVAHPEVPAPVFAPDAASVSRPVTSFQQQVRDLDDALKFQEQMGRECGMIK